MMRKRKIGPVLATAFVASNMIGSGIFLLPASLAAVGSVTMVGWAFATLGALAIAAVLARLGQIAPEPGGPCAYAEVSLGRYMGFQSYVLFWLCALVEVSVAFCLLTYVYACTAIWHFGQAEAEAAQLRFRALALFAMVFCVGVIVMSGTQLLALTAVVIFATCLAYPLVMRRDSRSTPRKA